MTQLSFKMSAFLLHTPPLSVISSDQEKPVSNVVFSSASVQFFLEIVELFRAFFGGGDPESLLFVVVEVGGVAGTLALRNEGGLDLKQNETNSIIYFFLIENI